jgi:lycopene cyclase domain-containing protein
VSDLYLIINLGAFIVPFIFSFHPKLQFYKKWSSFLPAIFISALLFIAWDIYFTKLGVWGFNPRYLSGIYFFNLPIEEVLFFICIPYSCLFTYHCFQVLIKHEYLFSNEKLISLFLIFLLIVTGLAHFNRLYTSVTFISLAFFLGILKYFFKVEWLSRFYFSYLILLIPFSIVNGILTGSGLEEPVVWYNNQENIGLRLGTIPFEDIFYGMMLILLNVSVYNYFQRKNAA